MNRQEQEEEILNQQQFKFKRIKPDLKKYFTDKNPKIKYEFQELGIEMESWFGQNIWWIFSKSEAELSKTKQAFAICKKKNIKKVQYLLGILQN